jgi:hypothetical protein
MGRRTGFRLFCGSYTVCPERLLAVGTILLVVEPLYHQGSVFSASYAALPHLMHFITTHAQAPQAIRLLQLVVCIEAARDKGGGPQLPSPLFFVIRSGDTRASRSGR